MLADAIEFQASVVIVGDFDADGATSCALAVSLLKQMGLEKSPTSSQTASNTATASPKLSGLRRSTNLTC